MIKYKILFNKGLIKDLKKIPKKYRLKLREKIESLSENPRPEGYKKLSGKSSPPLYRIRHGNYRVIYTINDQELLILLVDIGHRRGIYHGI